MHEPDSVQLTNGVPSGAVLHHLDVARYRASWPTVSAADIGATGAERRAW